MIYTPAPPRDSLQKKALLNSTIVLTPKQSSRQQKTKDLDPMWVESENMLRRVDEDLADDDSSIPQSAHHISRQLQMEVEELKQKLWEKDYLLQTMGQTPPEPHLNINHLQSQIEDLKQNLWEKNSLLETMANHPFQSKRQLMTEIEELTKQLAEKDDQLEKTQLSQKAYRVEETSATESLAPADTVNSMWPTSDKDTSELQIQVEKLQRELWEKDQYVQSAQMQLCEQQHELGEMRSLLEEAEIGIAKTHSKAASIEAELNRLRCQVLTLRYQLDAVDGTIAICGDQQQQQDESGRRSPPYRVDMVSTISDQEVDKTTTFLVCVSGPSDEEQLSSMLEYNAEKEQLELARRQYLAAVIAAREQPVKESFALVVEFRKQLMTYLSDTHLIDPFAAQFLHLPRRLE
ncbi:hypothetical protein BDL97_08G068300 [Sphagnum fallax]|nr:hypothetical protein BDL97_08G068300 [Sphagnum fallax]